MGAAHLLPRFSTFSWARIALLACLVVFGPTAGANVAPVAGEAPLITVSPESITKLAGKTVSLAVVAESAPEDGALTYQWYFNAAPVSGSAAKKRVYTFVASEARAGSYSVRVANKIGFSESAFATVTVHTRPKITSRPVGLTLDDGRPLTLSVAATGTPEPSFQWLRDGVEIPGATSATYHVDAVNALDTGAYSVRVSNSVGTVVSRRASVVVRSAPVIVDSPEDTNAYVGTPLRLSVIAYGFPKRSYQWRLNGEPIRGARSAVFVLKPTLAKTGVYDVVVTNALGSDTSEPFTVTVHAAPKLAVAPVGANKRVGQSHVFQVDAPAYPVPAYQWIKDGAELPGQTLGALALSPLKPTDEGLYSVRVTNALGSFTTKPVKLRVGLAPFGPVKNSTYRFDTTVYSDFGDSIRLDALFTISGGRLIIKDFTDNTLSSEKLDFTRLANDRVRMRFYDTVDGVKLTLAMNFYFATPTTGTVHISVQAGGYGVIGSGSGPFTYMEPGL
jgi:hypothetical protein